MTYGLIQLAPGAYDLLLNGEVVGSVVRNSSSQPYTWTAELLEDLPPARRPAPFTDLEHVFASLEDLCDWLGSPAMHGDAWER
ncbi:hypothetical protein KBI52_13745 [Microvirga sp. HBU67558]|uniref:hypothetical protein n=1 Tax=Microvirga TaxID=186650 RepID=UPI001B3608B2|nr:MULTISPECIES: hypothetical protein [unclassified Microvirga]MBQ0821263.1 hypothetical protein [Microvirga sp. HBU67558]